jgi:hypothetical protein
MPLSMTGASPQVTAWMRAAYWAFGTAALVALTTWATTDDVKTIVVSAGTSLLVALGFRGGVEGSFDSGRASNNDVRDSDVPVAAPDVQVIEPAKP